MRRVPLPVAQLEFRRPGGGGGCVWHSNSRTSSSPRPLISSLLSCLWFPLPYFPAFPTPASFICFSICAIFPPSSLRPAPHSLHLHLLASPPLRWLLRLLSPSFASISALVHVFVFCFLCWVSPTLSSVLPDTNFFLPPVLLQSYFFFMQFSLLLLLLSFNCRTFFLHIRFNLITIVLCLLSPSYFCFLPFSCPLLPLLFVIFFFHFSFLPLPQLVSSHCPPSLFRFLISLLPHPLFSPILLSAHSCFLLLTQSTSSSLTFSTAAHPVFLPLLLPTVVLLLYTSSVSCLLPPPFSSLICFSTPPHSLFCFYF